MKKNNSKPSTQNTAQNSQAPQDESPLAKPDKSKKDIVVEKKWKNNQEKKR